MLMSAIAPYNRAAYSISRSSLGGRLTSSKPKHNQRCSGRACDGTGGNPRYASASCGYKIKLKYAVAFSDRNTQELEIFSRTAMKPQIAGHVGIRRAG